MKFTLIALVLLASMTSAFAKDSTWNLCQGPVVLFEDNTRLVVNVYEHRNAPGRETNLTMIFGGHTLQGSLDSTESDSGEVVLKNDRSTYKGHIAIDYNKNTITLDGVLDVGAETPLMTKLKCVTLAD